jgi:hypothetical protein
MPVALARRHGDPRILGQRWHSGSINAHSERQLFLSLRFFLSLFTIFHAQNVASGLQSPVKKNQPDKIDLHKNKTCSEALRISILNQG